MPPHADHCAATVEYAERVFQHLEDNRPSNTPTDFSGAHPENPKTVKSKTQNLKSQLNGSNTFAFADIYTHSASGKFPLKRTGSFGNGRVKELVAAYEARSHHTEELAKEATRRKRELAAFIHGTPEETSTEDSEGTETTAFSDIEEDGKEWVKVFDADLD
ncbi:hypothetical protein CORC01_03903 [Colletotrichum orchidophilum]|uniref:Uncharacterized protein n=1 Tax=Colletotrichum orchidophilum TaxID=1209926 RepID=A0A1G4BHF0_9PEZI|nr:uncharacterized protein CORC01_03903 [Colletotrichum orchidophilum]OHF00829.1 hypothetical protein CORC01_03903 [Colletotrichum orchidophilum]